MENIRLLERHRRRVALLVALLVFLLLYAVIIIFQITSAYFQEQSENQQLLNRGVRVVSVVNNYDAVIQAGDSDLQNTVDSILKWSDVYSEKRQIRNDIWLTKEVSANLENDAINILPWWKLYKKNFERNDEFYTIIVGMEYKNIFQKISPTLLVLLLIGPFVYSLFAWIACRFMTQVYRPLKEIIMSLEAFASNVNHEFKTSLTEIISSLELAKVTKEYQEANEHSIASARRLDSILNSLGTMIHFVDSDYRKERVNIISLLDSSLSDFSRMISEKKISIIKKYSPNESIYRYVDAPPLLLCFQNILENAIKYSDDSGEIEIYITKNNFIIKDYGRWISKKNLDKIFDRYFREWYTKSGSGIGLSIIKKITEIYNWDIKVKSKKEKYTQITLKF